ncbi:Endo-1,3(4)-beta-glucanase 1 [Yarrowia sp. C11]|nr:Endo-1,3(4)-beta-glucanase 1 [Yarrowia sp. E02]KAG5372589.1 Endo-1,3(4)-beta-glucanase 1 [Yarrowia sp. C11]
MLQFLLLLNLALSASARVIHKKITVVNDVVVTPSSTRYVTITGGESRHVTLDQTIESVETVFVAHTVPTTVITGTLISTVQSIITANPVTQTDSYPTTADAPQINLETLTEPKTLDPFEGVVTDAQTIPEATMASAGSATPTATPSSFSVSIRSSSTPGASSAESTSDVSPSSSAEPSSSVDASSSSSSASAAASSSAAAPKPKPNPPPAYNGDLFAAIDTSAPPGVFKQEPLNIDIPKGSVKELGQSPVHTNKFYFNMFLGDRTMPVYTQPYSVWWSKTDKFPGIGVSYSQAKDKVYGPQKTNPMEYMLNPVGIMSFVFSAQEFSTDNMEMQVSDTDTFSATTTVSTGDGSMELPLVQGMGFVTAKYNGLTPLLLTQVGFDSVVKGNSPVEGTLKYVAKLFNGVTWTIYVTTSDPDFKFLFPDPHTIKTHSTQPCVIQMATTGDEDSDAGSAVSGYDKAAGAYPVSASLNGQANGGSAQYSIDYKTEGSSASGSTLIFALSHHKSSMVSQSGAVSGPKIQSTNKGLMYAYVTNSLTLAETLETNLQFLPWSQVSGFSGQATLSADQQKLIAEVANSELKQDIASQTNLDTNYFSGKALDKFAYILLVLSDMIEDETTTKSVLEQLKKAFAVFTKNTQQSPFIYDTLFKGVTSGAAQASGDSGADFGSPYYNDHHFHYSYFLHAAAVIGHVDAKHGDGKWVEENKDWVNALIRDTANPSKDDSYFPVYRSFDWFSGHSWAKGLFPAADGKDEESTSEDYNHAYGMKLWGKVVGDKAMEARGDLMLAVMKRSMNDYFYMKNDNKIQPEQLIGNKVPGITFENKLDFTTYFGTNPEYIHGIHMIPVTPVSSLLRDPTFVKEEWEQNVSKFIGDVDSGWLGILHSNQALYDPKSAYEFFAQDNFQTLWLDGGASRTWYLAYSAAVSA